MARLIRVTVVNAGGEYTGGEVSDTGTVDNLKNSIEDGTVGHYIEFDDGEEFEVFNYDNFFHVYGPHLPESKITVEESNDVDIEDDLDRNYSVITNSVSIDDTDINQFIKSNPYPRDFAENCDEDSLMVYSQKTEKRIHYPFVIKIEDGEEFDMGNIYLGSVNMDETINGDEILEDAFYIPKDKAAEYTKEYLGDDYEDDPLSDFISEIFMENHPLKETIIKNHSIESEEVEGKGEWENEYIKITDMDDDTLFEDGEY